MVFSMLKIMFGQLVSEGIDMCDCVAEKNEILVQKDHCLIPCNSCTVVAL